MLNDNTCLHHIIFFTSHNTGKITNSFPEYKIIILSGKKCISRSNHDIKKLKLRLNISYLHTLHVSGWMNSYVNQTLIPTHIHQGIKVRRKWCHLVTISHLTGKTIETKYTTSTTTSEIETNSTSNCCPKLCKVTEISLLPFFQPTTFKCSRVEWCKAWGRRWDSNNRWDLLMGAFTLGNLIKSAMQKLLPFKVNFYRVKYLYY